MKKHILFIQGGGGEKDHAADGKLADSLKNILGESYVVHYPLLNNESTPDYGRKNQIENAVTSIDDDEIILVGHSLGASMILRYLSEENIPKKIAGIFLLETPFWSGNEDWKQGLMLQKNFADNLPKNLPIFFYHTKDDEEIPFEHIEQYEQLLPQATFRKLSSGGHQLDDDLSLVARDIESLV